MVAADDVRGALEQILASEGFRNAERLTRFLRFTVERTLAGEGAELKEYRLGIEVYDRGADFDPRVDPIVRVEARRLRARLAEYYEGAGKTDAVRISLPKGGYTPAFEIAAAPEPSRRSWVWLGASAVGAVAVAVAIRFGPAARPDGIRIVVIPWAEEADREFADGLAEAVSAELSRSPRFEVVAWPVFVEYRRQHGGSVSSAVTQAARDLRAAEVLFVSVRRSGDRRLITGHLMNPEKGGKLRAGTYERVAGDGFEVQREVARAMAGTVVNGAARH